jgi:hypothetical protein
LTPTNSATASSPSASRARFSNRPGLGTRSFVRGVVRADLAAPGVVRATAEALVIHSNMLRQRLERIEALTGLALDDEDCSRWSSASRSSACSTSGLSGAGGRSTAASSAARASA